MTMAARRPWCFPCRAEGVRCWAEHFGIACDWHFGILSPADQQALRAAVVERHPRGGRVKNVFEQIAVVRMDIRNGSNTVEQTWRRDTDEFLAAIAAGGTPTQWP